MLHQISRMYHQVRDISLIKEYFCKKERLGKLRQSVHSWGYKHDWLWPVVVAKFKVGHKEILFAHCIIHLEHLDAKKLLW